MVTTSKIRIQVLGIEPEAIYQGTVYDQTVRAKLQNGFEIRLFDLPMPVVEEEMVGENIDVSIRLDLYDDIYENTDKKIGISHPKSPASKWNYDFVGEIREIDSNERSILLDIGYGLVSAVYYSDDIDELIESDNITIGTRLYLPDVQADIISISNTNTTE